MPNTSDPLPKSQPSARSRHVSVRLEPTEIARVDALVPSLIQFGTVPTRTIALRATILAGLAVLEPRYAAQLTVRPEGAEGLVSPNASDGRRKSQCHDRLEHVSVRLEIPVVARLDALAPSLIQLGPKPTRSDALRATILTGLVVLESPQSAELPPCPEGAVDTEGLGSDLDTNSQQAFDETVSTAPKSLL